ncbi:hypothetical protein [Aeromonas salmonicida]|uniref:hypothetical protein n=1 Tax=Aeromonas salmonicida TaxID=645 RepID=UPI003D1E40F9
MKNKKEENIVLPFHNIDGFIMINGAVGSVSGKFMLDTATPFDYLLNSNLLSLQNDSFFAAGTASSGQPITIYQNNKRLNINVFYGALLVQKENLKHANLDFIQSGISSDFLGMIGHEVLSDKLFEINYQDQQIIFYPINKIFTCEEDWIVIDLHGEDLSYPSAYFNIDGHKITAFFDTGNQGGLTLTERLEEVLIEAGNLNIKPLNSNHGEPLNSGAYQSASLHGLKYANNTLISISGLNYKRAKCNSINIGYEVLKNYRTVWDFSNRKISFKKKMA